MDITHLMFKDVPKTGIKSTRVPIFNNTIANIVFRIIIVIITVNYYLMLNVYTN